MQKNLAIELRLNNYYYKCSICGKWKNAFKEAPYAFTKVVGVQPKEGNIQTAMPIANFGPMFTGVLIDKKCFDKLEMDDSTPKVMSSIPKIVKN